MEHEKLSLEPDPAFSEERERTSLDFGGIPKVYDYMIKYSWLHSADMATTHISHIALGSIWGCLIQKIIYKTEF